MEEIETLFGLQPPPPAPLEDSDEEDFCKSCCEFGHNILCCPIKYTFRHMMKSNMINKQKIQAELYCQRAVFQDKITELRKNAEARKLMENITEAFPRELGGAEGTSHSLRDNDKIKFCTKLLSQRLNVPISLKEADFMFHTSHLVKIVTLHRYTEYFTGTYLLGSTAILKYFYYHMGVVIDMLEELGFKKKNPIQCSPNNPVVVEKETGSKNYVECQEKLYFSILDDFNLEKLNFENTRDHLCDFYSNHYINIHINILDVIENLLRVWTEERSPCQLENVTSVDPEDYYSCLPNRAAIDSLGDDELALYKKCLIDTIYFICCHSCLDKKSALYVMDCEQYQEKFMVLVSRQAGVRNLMQKSLPAEHQVAYETYVTQRLDKLVYFNKVNSWLNKLLLNVCLLMIKDVLVLSDPVMRFIYGLLSSSLEKVSEITRKDSNFKLEMPQPYMVHLVTIRRRLSYLEKSAERTKYIIPENDCSQLDMIVEHQKKQADIYNLLRSEVLHATYKYTWGIFLVLFNHWSSAKPREAANYDTIKWWTVGDIQECREAIYNLETLIFDCRFDLDPNAYRHVEEEANNHIRHIFKTLSDAYNHACKMMNKCVSHEQDQDKSAASSEISNQPYEFYWINEDDDMCSVDSRLNEQIKHRGEKDERIKDYLSLINDPCRKSLRNKNPPAPDCEERL